MTAHGIPPAIASLRRSVGTAIVLHDLTPHEVHGPLCAFCPLDIRPNARCAPPGSVGP